MQLGRSARRVVAAASLLALIPALDACRRRKAAEVNDIVPSFTVNRPRAPLGSATMITAVSTTRKSLITECAGRFP